MINKHPADRQLSPTQIQLTSPDVAYQEHSLAVSRYIIDEINKTPQKAIPFAQFMELALYAPNLGYYVAGKPVIGAAGDFVTAPEISPLFAECLAIQIRQVLAELSKPVIIEFGAGNGTLAAQLLLALEAAQALPQTYFILEPSGALKATQQRTLAEQCPHLLGKVTWLTALPSTPISGVIIANEVIDAMPVHRVQYNENGLQEYYVTYQNNQFQWILSDVSNAQLITHWQAMHCDVPTPYTTEINLFSLAWLNSVNAMLKQGAAFLIDYGFSQREYYHPSRNEGTLMCHYQHHAHSDPFFWPGLQDITSHVDFTQLAKQAQDLSLTVAGFIHQGAFLLNCGLIDVLLEKQKTCQNPIERIQLNQQVQQLTAPQEMGELFKVMALTRHITTPLLGFKQYDQQHRL